MRRSFDEDEATQVHLHAAEVVCEVCQHNLHVYRNRARFVHRLDGVYQVIRHDRRCPVEGCAGASRIYRPVEDLLFALPYANYGLDVVIEVGERHLRDADSLSRIGRDLIARGVPVSERHVGRLLRVFLALARLARGDEADVRERLRAQGGILLIVDGVQFDDTSPVLYVVWDGLSGEPLFGERKPFRGEDDIVPLLERAKAMEIPIIGVVSDKERGLVPAIVRVFPDVPHQLCQIHYVNNCARGMTPQLQELGISVSRRAEAVRAIAKGLHRAGWNSKENEPCNHGAPSAECHALDTPSQPVNATRLSEEQLAAELCAMARHASRATGRAPLSPPEQVRHRRLDAVRMTAAEAAKKGALLTSC